MNVCTQYRAHERKFGQIAEGNDFHRRQRDVEVIRFRSKADRKHAANMRAWRWLHTQALKAGNMDVANNIMQMKLLPNVA